MGGWEPDSIEVEGTRLRGGLRPTGTSVGGDFRETPSIISAAGDIDRMSEGGDSPLTSVSFSLLNFADYVGGWIDYGGRQSRGRVLLEAAGWRITLDARPSFRELRNALRDEGGYAFTHVGVLERVDKEPFSSDVASGVLGSLHWFLSFVGGFWVCPTLFEGLDAESRTRWRHWDSGRTGPWAGPPTWCDATNWGAAQEAFKGFMAEWGDEFGQAVLRTAVGQYVTANSPNPVEVAIIVAQSGLELLGWAELVEAGDISEEVWKGRSMQAADKIARLLDQGDISLDIPTSLPSLSGLDKHWRSGHKWLPGYGTAWSIHGGSKAVSVGGAKCSSTLGPS